MYRLTFRWRPRRWGRVLALMVLLGGQVGCGSLGPPAEIEVGMNAAQVAEIWGEADEVKKFTMPGEPFFGPQESLTDQVEPGTVVVEWRYQRGQEVTYVWFAGSAGDARSDWEVVATATVPQNAVY